MERARIMTAPVALKADSFCVSAGHRILVDDVYLNGKVFMPDRGMVNLPIKRCLELDWLIDEGLAPVEMEVYNDIHVGDGDPHHWVEPMFNAILFKALEKQEKLIGIEIGVHRGDNAERILEYLPIEKLFLIDPYDENPDYQPGNPDLKEAKEFARERLAQYGDKVEWIYAKSEDALPDFSNMDFVYHDSDHRRPHVEKELPLGYAAVKPGGCWGGHDYRNTWKDQCEVKSCVDEFVIINKLSPLYYSSTMLNWWVWKEE